MFLLVRWLYRRYRVRRAQDTEARAPARRSAPFPKRAGRRPPLALVLHQARFDLRTVLRNKQARYFTLLLPLLLLVLFVSIFGDNRIGPDHVRASTYYVPGLSALAVIAASFVNLVISITAQRESGVLKRRRSTPVPAWVLIAGRTLTAMAVSLSTLAVLITVGRVVFGVELRASAIPAVALTAILGSATFCALAYALSTRIRAADAAQPIVQAIMLPLYLVSGVFIPNVDLPAWLRDAARVFPVQRLADGLHHAYDPTVHGSSVVWSDLAVLAIWTVAGLALALGRFTWSPTTTSA
jgi:ABC-2 type transport system permease protein